MILQSVLYKSDRSMIFPMAMNTEAQIRDGIMRLDHRVR